VQTECNVFGHLIPCYLQLMEMYYIINLYEMQLVELESAFDL